jgi:ABC-type uncharacterized transport system auxiliary subunit
MLLRIFCALTATALLAGCGSEKERNRNRDRDRPQSGEKSELVRPAKDVGA